jgi:hypothetical protein
VLAHVPAKPLDDRPVPGVLLSADPAVQRGYDLHFTSNGLPLRGRPRFTMDGATGETPAGRCQKKSIVPKTRTAGVFTFFCEHQYCYGYALGVFAGTQRDCSFHILKSSEGRNDPFSVLKTFLTTPPQYVIFDFACSLDEYATNRDPFWFANTKFLIDRFHWRNHKRCFL